MPKRGGRGGSSRRKPASGGGGSNYGRINAKKKKSKGTSNNHRVSSNRANDVPELMDLNESMYVPAENSMKNLSKRPGRLMQEAIYTEKHKSETMGKTLRSRPVEFVKAKEVYDPSAKLFEKKESKSRFLKQSPEAEIEVRQVIAQDEAVPEISTENQELLDILNSPKKPRISVQDSPILTFSSGSDDSLDFEEEMEDKEEDKEVEEVKRIEEVKKVEEVKDDKKLMEDNKFEEVIQKVEDDELSVQNLNISEESPGFLIDNEGDLTIGSDYNFVKPKTYALVNRARAFDYNSDSDDAPLGNQPDLEHDNILTIGKVSLRTSRDALGRVTTELPSKRAKQNGNRNQQELDFLEESDLSDDNIAGYNDYISSIMREMQNNSDDEDDGYISSTNFDIMASSSSEEEDDGSEDEDDSVLEADIEYGFLPDDYEFDVSQVSVTNVRFGLRNQFYTKNLELTGSPDEFMWIDEQEFIDYVILKGVKEHRLSSFLKFITDGLIDQKYDEPNYSDVYISESEEDEHEQFVNDSDEDLGDDIDDLIEFTKKKQQNYVAFEDINPTRSLTTKGKGRKKQLDLLDRSDLDNEIRESLQEQYLSHKQRKKDKKRAKDDSKYEAGIKSNDLLVKYPYSLHIKEIRSEFEVFLHDGARDSMSFPPLDRHGNKVISKLASCYNFKSQTCGNNGLKQFVKVSKTRKTFHYLPRYNEVGHLLRQRPIFNRTDQKRPKDEITATDGNAKKDKARGRDKSGMSIIKEGEAVGAKAPEIGKDNIGRLLLEKLGWTSGEGLGAIGNKGINEPLLATMKKSKTGLK